MNAAKVGRKFRICKNIVNLFRKRVNGSGKTSQRFQDTYHKTWIWLNAATPQRSNTATFGVVEVAEWGRNILSLFLYIIYIIIYIIYKVNITAMRGMRKRNVAVLRCCCVAPLGLSWKNWKNGSLGRKNFFPGHGEKINENILKFLVKIFGGMKNIYYLCRCNWDANGDCGLRLSIARASSALHSPCTAVVMSIDGAARAIKLAWMAESWKRWT